MPSSHPLSFPSAPVRRTSPSPEAVAEVRALMEGTALSQGAIVRATDLGLRPLRRLMAREGWRRPPEAPRCPRAMPELLVRVGALAEGTNLTQRAIARELRVSPGYVSHCIRRYRWIRPLPERTKAAPVAVRWPKRPGRPFRVDVIAQARDLYTGTVLPLSAISARTGISFSYVSKLGRRYGWARPEGAPSCTRHLSLGRGGPSRRLKEGRRRVRALAESWAASWAATPEPAAAALGRARRLATHAASPPPAP